MQKSHNQEDLPMSCSLVRALLCKVYQNQDSLFGHAVRKAWRS